MIPEVVVTNIMAPRLLFDRCIQRTAYRLPQCGTLSGVVAGFGAHCCNEAVSHVVRIDDFPLYCFYH